MTSDNITTPTDADATLDDEAVVDITSGTGRDPSQRSGWATSNVQNAHDLAPRNASWITEDMTRFQVDLLAAVSHLAREVPDEAYGGAISTYLESWRGTHINHGRLYPNLDRLAEQGLIEKSSLDERTNQYKPSEDGLATLIRRWLALGHALGIDDDQLAALGTEVLDQ